MLRPRVLTLPAHIQGVYIHNLMKIFSFALLKAEENEDNERASVLTRAVLNTLPSFVSSSYLEVQERVSSPSWFIYFNSSGCGAAIYVVFCVLTRGDFRERSFILNRMRIW